MDGFTLIDGVVALVILVSGILAYSRGLLREVLAILGWIAAAVGAFWAAPLAQPWIIEIPVIGPVLAGSCELTVIAAFAVTFAFFLMLIALFTPLFSSLVRDSVLGGLDQALGFIFGVLRGVLLVAIALLVYKTAVPAGSVAMVEHSRSATVFGHLTEQLMTVLPEDAPGWVIARYEDLTAVCQTR